MQQITSEHNPKLKKAIRLHDSRGRRQQGRIIIFGQAEIERAVKCGVKLLEVYICSDRLTDRSQRLVERVHEFTDTVRLQLTTELFKKLSYGQRDDGIVAVADRPITSLNNVDWAACDLVLVLESIEKPGNLGAVYRSADAAGVNLVVLADPICDVFHPNAIRSSLATVFSIPTAVGTSEEVQDCLHKTGIKMLAARVDAEESCYDVDLSAPAAIVLGNEARGLSNKWERKEVQPITIPMRGQADSLNIAMAGTVLSFEARRQKDERSRQQSQN